ncbi:MAG: hypothetical protein IOC86_07610 [Aestuariivirga sp.]|nr:hypothetical protein [Aestuariivirga sp.]
MSPEEKKARRDLEKLEAEREKLFHGGPESPGGENDPMEILGRRIARILGPLLAAGMLLYLLLTFLPRT